MAKDEVNAAESLPAEERASDALHIRSLSKGLKVLGLFTVERPQVTLKDIVRETGFPRPTAYRLVRTLEDENYVVYDASTSLYHLGPAMIPALYLLKDHSNWVRLLHTHLQELADIAGEHASLAIAVERRAVVVDSVASSYNPFQPSFAVGRVHEGLVTAHSKVMAAYGPPQDLTAMLAEPHPARTPHTITDSQMLRAEMDRVVREGMAFDIEENWTGVCAVAAPVRDRSGSVVASVSVVVSVERFGAERRRLLSETVKTFATKMSNELGHSPEAS
jgi:DNA-binding IclR family transcriptional regulator